MFRALRMQALNAQSRLRLSDNLMDRSLTISAIDPDNWSASAYYEQGWFSGNSLEPSTQRNESQQQHNYFRP